MIVRALALALVIGGLASASLAQSPPPSPPAGQPPAAQPPGVQPPAAPPPGMVDPVGVYKVTGNNPDGSAYSGTITVTKAGLVWRVVWKAGDQTINGTALIMNGVLAVGYDGGVGIYRPQGNGWVGEWAERGQTAIGKESWERQ
jgi:hypothetical protein